MSRLVERSGYALQEADEESRRKQAELASNLVREGARSFFFGQDPPKQGFLQNPHEYAEDVLKQGSAFYEGLSDTDLYRTRVDGRMVLKEVHSQTSQMSQTSTQPRLPQTTSPAPLKADDVAQTSSRKIRDSVRIFKELLALPVRRDASIFSLAHRSLVAADFLTGDVINTLQHADKELAEAVTCARNAYRASLADSRAGEYLLAAECSRLRQELQRAYQAMDVQKQRALALIKAMDDRRLCELAQLEEKVRLTDKRREDDVSAVLGKAKEYGEQVRTLRAMVEGIKRDQSVQEVDLLRTSLAAEREKTTELVQKNEELIAQLHDLQTEFSSFKVENSDALSTIAFLRSEVSRLEQAKEYCKGCQDKIIEKAKLSASDLQKRIQRVSELSQALAVIHADETVSTTLSTASNQPASSQTRTLESQRKERAVLDYFDQIRRAISRTGALSSPDSTAVFGQAQAQAPPPPGGEPEDRQSSPQSLINPVDTQTFPLDILPLARQLCLVEARLELLPDLQAQQREIERLREESARLRSVERELADLRKIYRGVLARASATVSPPAQRTAEGGPRSESSCAMSGQHQAIVEGGITLLREQPLDLLVTRHFPVRIVDEGLSTVHSPGSESEEGSADEPGEPGELGESDGPRKPEGPRSLELLPATGEPAAVPSGRNSPLPSGSRVGSARKSARAKDPLLDRESQKIPAASLSVTPSYVAAIIQLFVRHLCMTAFTSETQFHTQLTGRILPKAEGTPVQCSYPVQALFTGFIHAQFHAQPEDRRRYLSELAICKVSTVLSAFQDVSSGVFIEDKCMWLSLGTLLLNTSISGDELMFLIYLTVLAYGGLPDAPPNLIPDLEASPRVTQVYITMERAMNITSITINKSMQRGFLDPFIQRGRATSLIKDMSAVEARRASRPGGPVVGVYGPFPAEPRNTVDDLDVVDAEATPAQQESAPVRGSVSEEPETVSVISINYFLISLLKAYRTELMSRLEATRVLYAGALLETSALLKSEKLSAVPDSMRYRMVREVIKTLSPIASDALVDAAYLGTVWRSPSANWSVLVDACKTRGIFTSALRFPPVEVIMGMVGGYRSQWTAAQRSRSRSASPTRTGSPQGSPQGSRQSPSRRAKKPLAPKEIASGLLTPTLVSKVRRLIDMVKSALLHLSAAMGTESAVATRSIVQEITNIDRAILSDDNVGVILNALRSTLEYAIELALSVVCSSGRDFGVENESIRRSLLEGRGVALVRSPRTPMEVCIDAMHYMVGTLAAVLGWDVDLSVCLESLIPHNPAARGR